MKTTRIIITSKSSPQLWHCEQIPPSWICMQLTTQAQRSTSNWQNFTEKTEQLCEHLIHPVQAREQTKITSNVENVNTINKLNNSMCIPNKGCSWIQMEHTYLKNCVKWLRINIKRPHSLTIKQQHKIIIIING